MKELKELVKQGVYKTIVDSPLPKIKVLIDYHNSLKSTKENNNFINMPTDEELNKLVDECNLETLSINKSAIIYNLSDIALNAGSDSARYSATNKLLELYEGTETDNIEVLELFRKDYDESN